MLHEPDDDELCNHADLRGQPRMAALPVFEIWGVSVLSDQWIFSGAHHGEFAGLAAKIRTRAAFRTIA